MSKFDRITWNPEILGGQPCIRGMRLTVRRVLEALATCRDRGELRDDYPELEDEDIDQASPTRPPISTTRSSSCGRHREVPS